MAHCQKQFPFNCFLHWDAPQLINLINMSQSKYPSFVRAQAKNGDEQSYQWRLYSSNEVGQNAPNNVHPKYSMK
jgi:hypothetical protein